MSLFDKMVIFEFPKGVQVGVAVRRAAACRLLVRGRGESEHERECGGGSAHVIPGTRV